MEELYEIYNKIKSIIKKRLKEFKNKWKEGSEREIFAEFIFCLLTPQSKAKVCWRAVENIVSKNMLLKGKADDIVRFLTGVRFKHKKASYIILAREKFVVNKKLKIKEFLSKFDDVISMREWLVKNIKGMGYKEASHFLRNIGFGKDIAILDRHILKNLKVFNVIDKIPSSLSKKLYFEIEDKMRKFSNKIKIPMDELDLLLWYKEAGEVFK